MVPKFWPVSEITSTDQISAITSTELVHDEVGDRAAMSQKSSLPQVTRFVSMALPPDTTTGAGESDALLEASTCLGKAKSKKAAYALTISSF